MVIVVILGDLLLTTYHLLLTTYYLLPTTYYLRLAERSTVVVRSDGQRWVEGWA